MEIFLSREVLRELGVDGGQRTGRRSSARPAIGIASRTIWCSCRKAASFSEKMPKE